ncbi:hypothetical protein ES705_18009 [subsurface metagenome]
MVSKMGKALSLWLVLAIIATCVGCGDEGPTDETGTDETAVTFPDSNLEAAIREAIGKPEGPIHTSELEGLSFLAASRRDITDLTRLEYCTNITHLSLAYNQVSDISPLASLTNLTWLHLGMNQASDISPLASLTNLTWLSLAYNFVPPEEDAPGAAGKQVSDISPLASLTNLTHLGLDVNQVSNISPLASLTNLTWLHLGMNQVSDISPLASLTNLTWLSLSENQISDISPLARLTNLEWLYLQKNDISDLSTLTGLTNLWELHLSDNNISDISPLVENSGLSKEDTVNLMNNPLGTTSVNVYIPQLEEKRVDVKYFKLHIGIVSCVYFIEHPYVSKEVELAADDSFTVILGSNRTTGFQWSESAQIDDQSVLEQLAHRFVPPEEDTPGAAGKEVWTFRALKEGSTEVSMEYSRPWEGGKEVEWTFRLIVIVK